jgi:hypothetical protein
MIRTASYTVIPKSNTKSELKPRRFDGAICSCKTINKVVKKTRIQPDVIKKETRIDARRRLYYQQGIT